MIVPTGERITRVVGREEELKVIHFRNWHYKDQFGRYEKPRSGEGTTYYVAAYGMKDGGERLEGCVSYFAGYFSQGVRINEPVVLRDGRSEERKRGLLSIVHGHVTDLFCSHAWLWSTSEDIEFYKSLGYRSCAEESEINGAVCTKMSYQRAFSPDQIMFGPQGMAPAIIQDVKTNQVLALISVTKDMLETALNYHELEVCSAAGELFRFVGNGKDSGVGKIELSADHKTMLIKVHSPEKMDGVPFSGACSTFELVTGGGSRIVQAPRN
ncbi:MAG: hypothetical protein K0S20_679 [Patescibacteria group bacterium]|nr:hypothetical protein [Patescibacteria group bacterium]